VILKKGKLIKKDDTKTQSYLDVQEFPWVDLQNNNTILADSPRGNIIRVKTHTKEEIEQKIKTPESFKTAFLKKKGPILPLDLNHDYLKNQLELITRKSKKGLGEDDLFAMELANIPKENLEKRNEANNFGGNVPSDEKNTHQTEESLQKLLEESFQQGYETAKQEFFSSRMEQTQEESLSKNTSENLNHPEFKEQHNQGYEQGHKQGYEQGYKEGNEQAYKEGHELGFLKGQQSGFFAGEQNAIVVSEQKAQVHFEKIVLLLSEIESLKINSMLAGKEIFIEMMKICSEKILRTELSFHDSSLEKVFKQMIAFHLEGDKILVSAHQTDATRLKQIVEKFEKNGSLMKEKVLIKTWEDASRGDLKAEGIHEVTMLDLKKSTHELIEKIADDLFNLEEPSEDISNAI
jgi:flagellar assembly protein FliH